MIGVLVSRGSVSVLPMNPPLPDRPWLLEVCPASTLTQLGLYGSPYKGRTEQHRAARERIVTGLEAAAHLSFADCELRRRLLDNQGGDALDSVVAAFAVARNLRNPAFPGAPHAQAQRLEGHVYA